MINVQPPVITFSVSEQEFKRGSLALYFRRLKRIALPFLVFAEAVLSLGAFSFAPFPSRRPDIAHERMMDLLFMNASVFAALSVMVVLMALFCWYRVGRRYRIVPEFFANLSWEIRDDGLLLRRGEDRMNFPWKFFKKAWLTKEFLMIERKDRMVQLLPRRCFPDGGKGWHDAIAERLLRPAPPAENTPPNQ